MVSVVLDRLSNRATNFSRNKVQSLVVCKISSVDKKSKALPRNLARAKLQRSFSNWTLLRVMVLIAFRNVLSFKVQSAESAKNMGSILIADASVIRSSLLFF